MIERTCTCFQATMKDRETYYMSPLVKQPLQWLDDHIETFILLNKCWSWLTSAPPF